MKRALLLQQLKSQGISDPKVFAAFEAVDRKDFVPQKFHDQAYINEPLPIGHGQTISQPYIVAFIAEKLKIKSTDRILEVGSGSGYQAAILGQLAKEVYGIEILRDLAQRSMETLLRLKYKNIRLRHGDGSQGWESEAPFDKILISAAAPSVPQSLFAQLKYDGYLIAPIGQRLQNLIHYQKTKTGIKEKRLIPVVFVPLTGTYGNQPQFV